LLTQKPIIERKLLIIMVGNQVTTATIAFLILVKKNTEKNVEQKQNDERYPVTRECSMYCNIIMQ